MSEKKIYLVNEGVDQEVWTNPDEFPTREAAEEWGRAEFSAAGNIEQFQTGVKVQVELAELIDVDYLLEQMICRAVDWCGEAAENYLLEVTPQEKDELQALIVRFFEEKGYAPTFYAVEEVETHEVAQP